MRGIVVLASVFVFASAFLSSKASRPNGYYDGPILHAGCHSKEPAFGPPSNYSTPIVLSQAQTLLKKVKVAFCPFFVLFRFGLLSFLFGCTSVCCHTLCLFLICVRF
jgi:hypothetical protein